MYGLKMKIAMSGGMGLPSYAHDGDAGLDLSIRESVTLEPNARATCGTGVHVEIPSGCVGLLIPRSGRGAKQGVTFSCSVGVIDSGYRGEVCAPLVNLSCDTVRLQSGSRVCQLVIVPFVPVELEQVESLGDSERGTGGFGSTGMD